ncbi:MAG TPA: flagellar hook-associated protein FlgL [Methylophilaceae bacterium]|jgi:flagellar hook-associated protein 3 FlgL|nr:flagellar hook-associated protein FlgL [Methylophilaceae bacterium]
MRISTASYFNMNLAAMQDKQATLFHVQQQMATGRRIVTPSDDPVGAARALQTARALSVSENSLESIVKAQTRIKAESTTLEAIRQVLQSAKDTAVSAGTNPSTQERTSFANYLTQVYEDLRGYANSTDAEGNYLFSGFKNVAPFQQITGASNYQGDNSKRYVSIGSNQEIQVSDSGQEVFSVGTANDPFAVISQFITDLQNGALTGAAFDATADTAISGLENALNKVEQISDHVAVRFQQLDTAKDTETQYKLQYEDELDRIESVDMQTAAVQLQLLETSLEATQRAFINASQLNLFNLL